MQDWQTFLKLDNASTIDFLTSYASALSSENLITERSVESLKMSFASITPKLASTNKSVLPLLAEHDTEFIAILAARYGVIGLAWNHMRMSTRNLLGESCANLASWADNALKKAELFMNRPFIAYSAFGETRRELFPSVLFHVAKTLHDTAKDLKSAIHELSLMRPADVLDNMGDQYATEERIALQIGYSGLEVETLSYCSTEQRAVRKVTYALDNMASCVLHIVKGLRENTSNIANSKQLEIECEILSAECQRLHGVRFEVSSNLDVWETRRLGFLYQIFSLNLRINQVAKLFSETLVPKDKLSNGELLTSDVTRAVICRLIKEGTTAKTATAAAADLTQYCKLHDTIPGSLIPAELKKINGALRNETLEFAAKLATDNLTTTPGGAEEKARFIDAAKKIRKALNLTVPFSAPLGILLFSLSLGSCGVKTQISSEIVDARAKIPFRGPLVIEGLVPRVDSNPKDKVN